MNRNYRGTTALITGASSGLGAEYAAQLAARGADVVLVARREGRLRELADRLTADHGVTATPIALDLARPDAAAALRTELDARGIRVQSLVNNAGFGLKGAFAEMDATRAAEMVQVNVSALVALTRELLPEMIADGRGVLISLASTAAYQPCPNMALYGATKAFVLSLTEALAYETKDSGLAVVAVSPGATRTEFFDVAGADASVGSFETPEEVVSRTLRVLDRRSPRPSFVSGKANAAAARIAGWMPRRAVLALSGRVLS